MNGAKSTVSISRTSRSGIADAILAGHVSNTPGKGRRERRAAETRLRLFRCALHLFAERGFSNVTVEDITEAADVGNRSALADGACARLGLLDQFHAAVARASFVGIVGGYRSERSGAMGGQASRVDALLGKRLDHRGGPRAG